MLEKYLNKTPIIAEESFVHSTAVLIGAVEVASKCTIWPNVVMRGDIAPIIVGECSSIQDGSVVHVATDLPCIIGKNVTIGHNVTVHACTIEDNCLIGMGAVVLDGAVIGEGSTIGAGSVVPPNKKIPANSVVMGVPGKIVKEATPEQVEGNILHAQKYWELGKTFL